MVSFNNIPDTHRQNVLLGLKLTEKETGISLLDVDLPGFLHNGFIGFYSLAQCF